MPSPLTTPNSTNHEAASTPIYPGDAADGCEVIGGDGPARHEAAQHGWRVLGILSALMAFASISTDVYLPAMPAMGRALDAPHGAMEWTVSGYLIGFCLGQLFWGPTADRIGRRRPVAVGLVLFAIGAAGCAMSANVWQMIGWRVVQAVGASASVVLARAMVRDLFVGDRAAQMLSTLMTVMTIAPLIGPLVGAQVLLHSGWRAIFWGLAAVGLLTLFALYTLPETLPAERRSQEPLSKALATYGQLIFDRRLLGYAGAGGFFYAGMFAYVAGTPFAFINYHHLPPQQYSLVFSLGIIGITASNLANSRLVRRLGGDCLLRRATAAAAVAGLVAAVAAMTDWGGLIGLIIPLFVFLSAAGFIIANSISGALSGFPEHAGAVSALVGAFQYGSGILGSALVGAFADGTPRGMGWVMALTGLGAMICARFLIKRCPAPVQVLD